jgi:hypothetical protein
MEPMGESGDTDEQAGRSNLVGRDSVEPIALAEPEIVTKKGRGSRLILPIEQYQEILERLEDAEDVAWLKKARRKKLQYRPLEDVLAGLAKS